MQALIVVDLGFGDAGKGLLTDYLVRRTGATVVVRYNGGAQAGHNVVTADGRHHTFAQLGAGSFVPGVRTILSRHVVVHPTALLREAEVLAAKGVAAPLERLLISEQALLVTPFHQAAGRLRELLRGDARHGSCGVGIGETVGASLADPEGTARARDLVRPVELARKLARSRERLLAELADRGCAHSTVPAIAAEWHLLTAPETATRWLAAVAPLAPAGVVVPDAAIARAIAGQPTVIFEGAQGVLLDEQHGFHPHTTWSRCTAENAEELLAELAPQTAPRRIGVLRSHAVRHGPGPLPTEDQALRAAIREHNQDGPWQGPVRYGWFDAVLARYALAAVGRLDALAVTHLDAPPRLGHWHTVDRYATAEPWPAELVGSRQADGALAAPRPPAAVDLDRQQRLGQLLARVQPVATPCEATPASILARIAELLDRPVAVAVHGPRAEDVTSFDPPPQWLGRSAGSPQRGR